MISTSRKLLLASRSPRRRDLLEQAGFSPEISPPALDDGALRPGQVAAEQWVLALAYFKVRQIKDSLGEEALLDDQVLLAADTICLIDGEIIGKPADENAARGMLLRFRNTAHRTLTGVCLLDVETDERECFVDVADVRMGELSDEAIESYLASGEWEGKAGGYNLSDRIADGWPVECSGDPSSVMGLPMKRLAPLLRDRLHLDCSTDPETDAAA